jgi:predicted Zn finger-like uncharacterized protein
MNLLCPNCQKMIQVSEQYAGQDVRCPLCNATFTVPVLPPATATPVTSAAPAPTAATVATPGAPPEPDVYSLGPPEAAPRASALAREEPKAAEPKRAEPKPPPPPFADGVALPQLTPGYQHIYSIWVSPRVLKWLPLAALALVFLSMFSTWIVFIGQPDERLTGWQLARGNAAGLLYVVLFALGLLLSVAAAVLPNVPPERLHPTVPQLLPWSSAIVGGVTVFAFLFLMLSFASGYNAENAPDFGTGWLRFGVCCLVIAVVTAAMDVWLSLRPGRPLPRIDISW